MFVCPRKSKSMWDNVCESLAFAKMLLVGVLFWFDYLVSWTDDI